MYIAITIFFRLLLQHYLQGFFILAILSGCATYNNPLEKNATELVIISPSIPQDLYYIVPRHRSQLRWVAPGNTLMWAIFGNDDDGIYGEDAVPCYRPLEKPNLSKAMKWWFRNPLHNFCFYVIGSAHRSNSEFDILQIADSKVLAFQYRAVGHKLFVSKGTSLYIGLHGGKPFISLRLCYHPKYRLDFYFGWRERGNFGIKFLPFVKVPKAKNI